MRRFHDGVTIAFFIKAGRVLLTGFFLFILLTAQVTGYLSASFAATGEMALSNMDLTQLSIDELMEIEVMVTSAAKKPQTLFHTPSASYVLTSDDIRRSGATSIPDLLRMVPGVQVARINANKWAITARGFNGRFATKLLVMMDGRSVYSPLFSGVYWDAQDTLIEDIERIEVVRGPGGSLWGTNAVNGIINIITKHATDTQGGLITAGAGNEERAFGAVRYGGKLEDKGHYRLYAKYFDREEGGDLNPLQKNSHWQSGRTGFRTDMTLSPGNEVLFQGDYFRQHSDELLAVPQLTPPFSLSIPDELEADGGNFLTRWQHRFSKDSDFSFQVYYDYTSRENRRLIESRHTLDFDFQHRFKPNERHEIVWGLGYRSSWDNMSPTCFFEFDPRQSTRSMPSAFIQDAVSLIPEFLVLNLGTKAEYNDYSGVEFQPSAQLLFTPAEKHAFWMAVTRAVRTPDRIETDSIHNPQVIPGASPLQLRVFGMEDIAPEEVLSYELGYRLQLASRCVLDIALFYSDYDKLRSFESRAPFIEQSPAPPHRVLPIYIDNQMDGETYGFELAMDMPLSDRWRVRTGYTFFDMQLKPHEDSNDTRTEETQGYTPHHQVTVRSLFNPAENLDLDAGVRFVDKLQTLGVNSYWAMDTRVSWRPSGQWEISVVAQNLFDDSHAEWAEDRDNRFPTEIERSIFGKISWKF